MPNSPKTASTLRPDLSSWPALPAELKAIARTPEHRDYHRIRSSYMRQGHPSVIFMAETETHVQQAVSYATNARQATGTAIPFSVRSGGHGIAGTSTNDHGIIVDLTHLDRIEVNDPERGAFTAQAGADWGTVARTLMPHDLALTSGNVGSTGVGGLATAGGVGFFARSQGLTLDHVRRVRLVTADASIKWVDAEHDPDLFWAARGGATQAGIAVDIEFDAPRLESQAGNASIIHQEVQYLVTDVGEFTQRWGDWMAQAPRAAESFLILQNAGGGRTAVQALNVWANDDIGAARPTLEAALGLAQVRYQQASALPYATLIPPPQHRHPSGQVVKMRDVLIDRADLATGEAAAASLQHDATILVELRALGGAVADTPSSATAWAGRHQEVLAATWIQPTTPELVAESFAPLHTLGTGSYGAYSSDTSAAAAALTWPGETGDRLRKISDLVDPDRLFDGGLVLPKDN